MAVRPNREQPAETTYHVTAHANDDRPIFLDDRDRVRFLTLLSEVVTRCDWHVHAYCLMDTHYHLMAHTPTQSLAAGMARLNGLHAQAYNRRHRRRGHLFRDRYWSVAITTDAHLLEAMRYIVRNPVEAGLCTDPADWPWSNYRPTAGLAESPVFLRVQWTRRLFAANDADACAAYRTFVKGTVPFTS
jgi:REP-associated tyrosine transposase